MDEGSNATASAASADQLGHAFDDYRVDRSRGLFYLQCHVNAGRLHHRVVFQANPVGSGRVGLLLRGNAFRLSPVEGCVVALLFGGVGIVGGGVVFWDAYLWSQAVAYVFGRGGTTLGDWQTRRYHFECLPVESGGGKV